MGFPQDFSTGLKTEEGQKTIVSKVNTYLSTVVTTLVKWMGQASGWLLKWDDWDNVILFIMALLFGLYVVYKVFRCVFGCCCCNIGGSILRCICGPSHRYHRAYNDYI